MAVLNNIYPPEVPTYAKPFLIDAVTFDYETGTSEIHTDANEHELEPCIIYFSISSFNNKASLKNAQISIVYQDTNITALDESQYPTHIMLTQIYEDENLDKSIRNRYFIKIEPKDLAEGHFRVNQYYKVQIRFTGTQAQNVNLKEKPQYIDKWLTKNSNYFSEWSSVVLVRGISTPTLSISNFDYSTDTMLWTASSVELFGRISFANPAESDSLRYYRVKVYHSNELIYDSQNQYTNNYQSINEINHTVDYLFIDGEEYSIRLEYETHNLYEGANEYNFIYFDTGYEKIDADIESILDQENARIGIHIYGEFVVQSANNIIIRRSSSESNFTVWEDMHNVTLIGKRYDYTWYDMSVKSGVWYKYGLQKRDSLGNRGVIKILKDPLMMEFEYSYLVGQNGQQLKLKFNNQVSNFQRKISESQIETIGNKYPFVRRNGYMDYKQFPLTALISHFTDEDGLMINRNDMYSSTTLELYDAWNNENRITPWNDVTYERDFREKVQDFLMDGTPKLFRSPTEGNILVQLTGITFAPFTSARYLYSFSCTANEIADCTISNLDSYGIQKIGTYSSHLNFTDNYIGQLNENFPADKNIIEYIKEHFQKSNMPGWTLNTTKLDYLRLEINSEPYLIQEVNGIPQKIIGEPSEAVLKSALLGTIVNIEGKNIIIGKDGIYEIANTDVAITSISFPYETDAMIDFHVIFSQEEDTAVLMQVTTYRKQIGQKYGTFDFNESIYQNIWNKYYYSYNTYIQLMMALDMVQIEADPGTIVYIKKSGEDNKARYIIGDTGMLELYDDESVIENIEFYGMYLDYKDEDVNRITQFTYEDEVDDLNDITNPIINGVYTLTTDGLDYIYYNYHWYRFLDSHIVACPVDGIVNYVAEILTGYYQSETMEG